MGMFDTVKGICPHCGADVKLQSKAGDCLLRLYPIEDVPLAIADDLRLNASEYNTVCKNCDGDFAFQIEDFVPKTVRCILVRKQ